MFGEDILQINRLIQTNKIAIGIRYDIYTIIFAVSNKCKI